MNNKTSNQNNSGFRFLVVPSICTSAVLCLVLIANEVDKETDSSPQTEVLITPPSDSSERLHNYFERAGVIDPSAEADWNKTREWTIPVPGRYAQTGKVPARDFE